MTTTRNYPEGEAGPDSESGPVDDTDVDGADEAADATGADLVSDGSLGAGSTATGGATEPRQDGSTGPGGARATPVDHHPEALVEHGRVATPEDME